VRTSASPTLSEPHARLGVIEKLIPRASSASCTLRTVTALLVIGLAPRFEASVLALAIVKNDNF
jgi:hypothetical protein